MWKWFTGTGAALGAAALAFFAFMAVMKARREKDIADQWKQKSIDDMAADVRDGTDTAKAALLQAKLHETKSREVKADGKKKLDAIKDDDIASIVSSWRKKK